MQSVRQIRAQIAKHNRDAEQRRVAEEQRRAAEDARLAELLAALDDAVPDWFAADRDVRRRIAHDWGLGTTAARPSGQRLRGACRGDRVQVDASGTGSWPPAGVSVNN